MSIDGWRIKGLVEQNEGEWWFDLIDPSSGLAVPSVETHAALSLTKDGDIHPTRVIVYEGSAKSAIEHIKRLVKKIVSEREQERKRREADLVRRALRYDVVLHD